MQQRAQRDAGELLRGDSDADASAPSASSAPVDVIPLHGMFGHDLANWLFPAYQIWILLGFLVLRYGHSVPEGESNGVRSLFMAINAATLTGFTQDLGPNGYLPMGRIAILFLMIGGSLFSMIVGGLAVVRIVRMRYSDADVIRAAFIAETIAVGAGAAALSIRGGRSVFESIFQAAAAFGNCGLSLGHVSGVSEAGAHLVILPMALMGGLGLPVLMELFDRVVKRQKTSIHTKAVLAMSAWVFIVGMLILVSLTLATTPRIDGAVVRSAMALSSASILQARTLGPLINVQLASGVAQWIILLIMLLGGASAGTAGGLKITTLNAMIGGTRKCLRGQSPGRSFGIATAWSAMYGGIILAGVLLLTYVLRSATADVIFLAVSAASNTGLSMQKIPQDTGVMYALCAIMLLGRMAPLMVLWWAAESTTDAQVAVA